MVFTTKRLVATTKRLIATTKRLVVITKYLVATTKHLVATTKRLIATTKRLVVTTKHLVATTKCVVATAKYFGCSDFFFVVPKFVTVCYVVQSRSKGGKVGHRLHFPCIRIVILLISTVPILIGRGVLFSCHNRSAIGLYQCRALNCNWDISRIPLLYLHTKTLTHPSPPRFAAFCRAGPAAGTVIDRTHLFCADCFYPIIDCAEIPRVLPAVPLGPAPVNPALLSKWSGDPGREIRFLPLIRFFLFHLF